MKKLALKLKKFIFVDNALSKQDQSLKNDFYHSNLYFGTAAGILLCVLAFIGVIGTIAQGSVLMLINATFVYSIFFITNFVFLCLFNRERRLFAKDPAKCQQNILNWFMGINMILASMTFYTTQEGSSFFFEYILVTAIIYLVPNTDSRSFFRNALINIISMFIVLNTFSYRIVLQDLVDMIGLHIMCGVVNEVRWRSFLRYEATKFSIEKKRDEFYKNSRTDELTGLLNRAALRQDFAGYLDHEICIALMDIDVFKNLNDTYGHSYGDQILRLVSKNMKAVFGDENERCYRYGGDEFLIISRDPDAQMFYQKLTKLRKVNEEKQSAISVSASVGYTRGTAHSEEELRALIRIADRYLYQAKSDEAEKIQGSFYHTDRETRQMFSGQESFLATLKSTDEVAELFYQKKLSGKDWSIAYMNINEYSELNEALGYRKGYTVLEKISRIIHTHFPDSALINREVDHFVLYSTLPEKEFVYRIRKIQVETAEIEPQQPIILRAGIYHHSSSEPPTDFIAGMFKAKYASDIARDITRSERYLSYYNAKMDQEKKKSTFVHNNFQTALREGSFEPYYQPIIGPISGTVCGFEALSRWIDPQAGIIPPVDYIPYLEKMNEVYQLDLYFLDRVCRDLASNRKRFPEKLFVNVNLSQTDFEVINMPAEIDRIVSRNRISKRQIQFEITESAFVNTNFVRNAVKELHDRGYRLWIDDFGVGESSLSSFQNYMVEGVKLDQSFFKDFTSHRAQITIKSVVDLSHEAGSMMIAEGIENREQLWLARQWGINYIQGFFFSRPLPLEQLLKKDFMRNLTDEQTDNFYQTVADVSLVNDFSQKFLFRYDASLWLARAVLEWNGRLYMLRGNTEMQKFIRDSVENDGPDCVFKEDAGFTVSLMKAVKAVGNRRGAQTFRFERDHHELCGQVFFLTGEPGNGRSAYVLNITNFDVFLPEARSEEKERAGA
jgi:diguanylate cyclase (GGDEF)-like protein